MLSVHAAVIVLAAASGSSKTTPTTSNPLESLLPLILIFGVAYVFFLRPRSQQARRQRETLMELSAGDEVLTGAGIFGTVLDVEPDRVTLETAPGTRITVLRSTIARKVTDPAVETPGWDEHDEDDAHDAYQEYEHDEHDEHDEHAGDDEHDEHAGDDEHDEHGDHADHAETDEAEGEHDEAGAGDTPAEGEHVEAEDQGASDTDGADTDEAEDKPKT